MISELFKPGALYVPYTDALQGDQNMTPKYDKGADVYASLLNDIQGAIDNFGTAIADGTLLNISTNSRNSTTIKVVATAL